jgi:hypothetical protein
MVADCDSEEMTGKAWPATASRLKQPSQKTIFEQELRKTKRVSGNQHEPCAHFLTDEQHSTVFATKGKKRVALRYL